LAFFSYMEASRALDAERFPSSHTEASLIARLVFISGVAGAYRGYMSAKDRQSKKSNPGSGSQPRPAPDFSNSQSVARGLATLHLRNAVALAKFYQLRLTEFNVRLTQG